MYEQREDDSWKRWWGRAFVVGSVTAPFFLGMFTANWLLGATTIVTLPGIVVGLAVVALTVVDGVAFLRLKTRGDLRADLQTGGYRALGAYLVLVVLALGYIYVQIPTLRSALVSPLVVLLVVLTLVLAAVYAVATNSDRYYLAFGAGAGLVFALVSIVAALMYPTVDPAVGLTVDSAVVSTIPLNLITVGAVLLLPLVFLYFGILYSAFSGPIDAEESY
jgi:cytochrome d ubiquinol oxidase subunit II